MKPSFRKIFSVALALLGLLSASVGAEEFQEQIRTQIQSDLLLSSSPAVADGSEVLAQTAQWMSMFYTTRNFSPAWIDAAGIRPEVPILIRAIRNADQEGLQKKDYPLQVIDQLMAEAVYLAASGSHLDPQDTAILDMALTTSVFLYAAHLSEGQLTPEWVDSAWQFQKSSPDMARQLQNALNEGCFESFLECLAPQHEGYRRLKTALHQYETIRKAGGWRPIPSGGTLRQGDRGERVLALRNRLAATGDLAAMVSNPADGFDETLTEAVQRFQRRNGLTPDGIVGAGSLAALNVPVEERLSTIKINLERWRWLPRFMGQRYIMVNIPGYELEVFENGRVAQRMRVVVGRTERPTPVFSGRITYLELNPYWHIPPTIATHDILPKIKQDPDYLVRHRIRVFASWQDQAAEIDPLSIDWNRIQPQHFPYKLRQEPAPFNSLGQVKFMFPNQMSIYLHDTPARELFHRDMRNFSSGCVRVEKPKELADYLLKADPRWDREKLTAALQASQPRVVWLKDPMAVYLLYWTAWVDQEGVTQFREDIYTKDDALAKALENRTPDASVLRLDARADEMIVSRTSHPFTAGRNEDRGPSGTPGGQSNS